jgi:predicted cobalt transporter CbtA
VFEVRETSSGEYRRWRRSVISRSQLIVIILVLNVFVWALIGSVIAVAFGY